MKPDSAFSSEIPEISAKRIACSSGIAALNLADCYSFAQLNGEELCRSCG